MQAGQICTAKAVVQQLWQLKDLWPNSVAVSMQGASSCKNQLGGNNRMLGLLAAEGPEHKPVRGQLWHRQYSLFVGAPGLGGHAIKPVFAARPAAHREPSCRRQCADGAHQPSVSYLSCLCCVKVPYERSIARHAARGLGWLRWPMCRVCNHAVKCCRSAVWAHHHPATGHTVAGQATMLSLDPCVCGSCA